MMSLTTRKSWRIGGDSASGPVWSPDGRLVAFSGREGEQVGLMIAAPDGSGRHVHRADRRHESSAAIFR